MERTCFLYYKDWATQMLQLPDELRLKIDDAIKHYVLYGQEPDDKEVLYSMFALMRIKIDQDNAAYKEKCNSNRKNICKRWNTNVYDGIRTYTNDTDKDKDKDKNNKETSIDAKKKVSLNIEKRKEVFRESIEPYREKYHPDMLNDFYEYWTETNKSKTKMRFEGEKTWETGKRLSRWKANNNRGTSHE